MTYSNEIILIKEFNDDKHKQLYYDNLYRILGINDLSLINKLILSN
jgi:hypothetical protein